MKHLICLLLLLSFVGATAQEFSFDIVFEDALGNQDVITVGYDANATSDIDAAFGEVNSIGTPYNSGIDVRITDEWEKRMNGEAPTFHTKKQIYTKACPTGFDIPVIDIVTDNWPVTATWDNTLFEDVCREGSVFTSINPGGWWDTGSPSDLFRTVLANESTVTFTSNYDGFFNENYNYMNDTGDIIPVFWQTFSDLSLILGVAENEQIDLTIFPNPTSDVVTYKTNASDPVTQINVYDLNGRRHTISQVNNTLDVKKLASGMYFIEFVFSDTTIELRRLIKK